MRTASIIVTLVVGIILSLFAHTASAQLAATTAFTYQGSLADSGTPANGTFDIRFSLWNALDGGVALGLTQTQSGVTVTNGLFTTKLDFGAQFNSERRFLQLSVSPAGADEWTDIAPRQEITATPMASSLVLPWVASTPAFFGMQMTANFYPIYSVATNAVGVGLYAKGGEGVHGEGGQYGGKFIGTANNAIGVLGQAGGGGNPLYSGVYGFGQTGTRGESSSGGVASYGVYGVSHALGGNGVTGEVDGGGNAYAIWGKATNGSYAGYFAGNVFVAGSLGKSGGSFKIDHPLDPANKFLSHSFVESPDMMNIYNGNITTDARGYASITMPDYFEALNRDFRYQLTVIDTADSADFVQAKVVRPIKNNVFTIRTSAPGTSVSWQVTGVRHDAWANAHRIPNEEPKLGEHAGRYIHPELFGATADRALDAAKVTPRNSDKVLSEMTIKPQ